MVKYLVSILVSNNIVFLNNSVKSVLKQTYNDFHIMIVINTNDELFYQDTIKHYQNNDKIKKIIRTNSNGYPGKGHNSVLELFNKFITYDYLVMIDGDDFLFPNALSRIDAVHSKSNYDVLTLAGNTFLTCPDKSIHSSIDSNDLIYNLNKSYKIRMIKNIGNISDEYNQIWATPFRLLSLNRKILSKYNKLYDENMYIYDDFLYYMIIYKEINNDDFNIVNLNDSYIYLYNKLNEDSVSQIHANHVKGKSDENQQKEILKTFQIESFDATKIKIIPSRVFDLIDDNLNITNTFLKNIINNVDSQVRYDLSKKILFIDTSCQWNYHTINNQPLGGTQTAIYYMAHELSNNYDVYVMTVGGINIEVNKNLKFCTLIEEYIIKIKPDIVIFQGRHIKDHDFWKQVNPFIELYIWCHHDINVKFVKDYYKTNNFHKYLFVSNWQKNRYIEHFKINPSDSYVISNGISNKINLNLSYFDKKEKVIVFCSSPYRGLVLAYQLFKKIKEMIPDIIFKVFSSFERDILTVKRDVYNEITSVDQLNNNNLDKAYVKLYQYLIEDDNIQFYGSVPQNILFHHLESAMLLFYPNIYPETCCINILEAMAFDCNVISSSLGAIPETSNGLCSLHDPVIDVNTIDYSPEKAIELNLNVENVSKKYIESFITNTVDIINNYRSDVNKIHLMKQKEYIKKCTWKERANTFYTSTNQYDVFS